MALWLKVLIGAGVGLIGGALLGYFGKCSSGTCPLTANPYRGALFGAIIGAVFATMLGPSSRGGSSALADVPEVADADFEQRVLKSEKPVLVDFQTSWCGYCTQLAPTISRLAKDYRGRVEVVKVDGDASGGLVARYGVDGYPVVLVFAGGIEMVRISGARGEVEYRKALDEVLADKSAGRPATQRGRQ